MVFPQIFMKAFMKSTLVFQILKQKKEFDFTLSLRSYVISVKTNFDDSKPSSSGFSANTSSISVLSSITGGICSLFSAVFLASSSSCEIQVEKWLVKLVFLNAMLNGSFEWFYSRYCAPYKLNVIIIINYKLKLQKKNFFYVKN